MASAAFHFAAQGSLLKYSGTAGGTVTATLDSVNGVDYAVWALEGTDETSDGEWSLSTSTGTSTVVTLPATGTGKAAVLRCTVNGDPDITATAKVYIAPEVGAVGEQSESDADFGQGAFLNPALRSVSGLGTATPLATPSTVASRDGSGNSAFVGVTTASVGSTAGLTFLCAAASNIRFFEGGTEVLRVDDQSGVAVLAGQGASGTLLTTGAGPLTVHPLNGQFLNLDSTQGTRVRNNDGSSTYVSIDSTGLTATGLIAPTLQHGGNIGILAPSYIYARSAGGVFLDGPVTFRSSTGAATHGAIDGLGMITLPVQAAASVPSPAAGYKTLFFNSSNSDKLSSKNSGGTVTVIGTET